MIQAVIFDMDGLLIDSEPLWRQSHVEVVADHGHAITTEDVRVMTGRRTDEVVTHWRQRFGITASTEQLETQVVGKVIAGIRVHGEALPGVHALVAQLQQHGIPLAVASSSAPEVIEAVMQKLELADAMALTHSAKYEQFGKPHPAVFVATAKKLGVMAANCLVLEDSYNGVKAAKAAGMKCIAVPEVYPPGKRFAIADQVVPSLEEVTWEAIQAI